MARHVDTGRLRSLVSGPGIDTRYHICEAVIDDVRVDPAEGVFCDISLLPLEQPETAFLGVPYAGDGFGFYFPVEVDDIVLVAIPDGDPGAGPIIISRMWSAADKPFTELQGSADSDNPGQYNPSSDVVLKTKAGSNYKTIVSGGGAASTAVSGGGDITLAVTGGGDVEITAGGASVVKLQDASQAFVRGDNFDTAIDAYSTAIQAYSVGVAAVVTAINTWVATTPVLEAFPASVALHTALTTTFAPIQAALVAASANFRASSTVWLSTRVKGQ